MNKSKKKGGGEICLKEKENDYSKNSSVTDFIPAGAVTFGPKSSKQFTAQEALQLVQGSSE